MFEILYEYQCNYINVFVSGSKVFLRRDHLKSHLRVHNPARDCFTCTHCGKQYQSARSYKYVGGFCIQHFPSCVFRAKYLSYGFVSLRQKIVSRHGSACQLFWAGAVGCIKVLIIINVSQGTHGISQAGEK